MDRIDVGRYKEPGAYVGWVACEHEPGAIPDWALFVRRDGRVELGVKERGELMFSAA